MTGLEYLKGVVDGSIPHPSMAHTLGFMRAVMMVIEQEALEPVAPKN